MNKPACIIFDCDGVLVDSETIGIRVLLEMAGGYGVKMDMDEAVLDLSGRRLKEAIDMLQTRTTTLFPGDFEKSFRTYSYEVFKKELQPVKGIKTVLDSLDVPYCVASSGPVEKIKLNLGITGLLGYFENRIYSAYDIQSWKPDPGIFLHAAKEMGFSPINCAVVEDSKAGVMAAVTGGFKAYGYANAHSAKELEKEGATVFYDMMQLPSLLFSAKQ